MKKTTVISCVSALIGVNAQKSTSEKDQSLSSIIFDEVTILTTISVVSSLVTLYESLYLRIGPQDTASEEILEIVKRLENATTASSKAQYLNNEEFILRSLYDMNATQTAANGRRKRSELPNSFQAVAWLQKARELDGNILNLMKGLLGQLITGNDLMESMGKRSKCNLAATRKEMQGLLNLITSGSQAVSHFAYLGYMPHEEIDFRKQLFSARYLEVLQRSESLYRECAKIHLSHILLWTKKKRTDEIADKIANTLTAHSDEYLKFVIAVYREIGSPMKTKSSARYVIANPDGIHVAVFPVEGRFRKSVKSNLIEEFCNRPIFGAGEKTYCDVGSVDGVFVYDRLRNEGIVPFQTELAVIPKAGRLAVRQIPQESLSDIQVKSFPDFDILLF